MNEDELREAARPLMEWLHKNGTSDTKAIVRANGCILSEDKIAVMFNKFNPDTGDEL